MEANELMIGNLLRDKVSKTELKVIELREKDIVTYVIDRSKFPLQKGWGLEPIPLTEEWLLKLGFELNGCNFELPNFRFHITKPANYDGFLFCDGCSVITEKIKYVHQLQNLYFALTGTHLTLK